MYGQKLVLSSPAYYDIISALNAFTERASKRPLQIQRFCEFHVSCDSDVERRTFTNSSGAIQKGVPRDPVDRVFMLRPKSAILAEKLLPISMLADFKSLCKMGGLDECRYIMPLTTPSRMPMTISESNWNSQLTRRRLQNAST